MKKTDAKKPRLSKEDVKRLCELHDAYLRDAGTRKTVVELTDRMVAVLRQEEQAVVQKANESWVDFMRLAETLGLSLDEIDRTIFARNGRKRST